MVAFLTRMPAGYPGSYNRTHDATVEPMPMDPAGPAPTAYGVAVQAFPNGARLAAAGGRVYGFYVRPYPTQSGQDPLGTSTPPTPALAGNIDVMVRGYMAVRMGTGSVAVPAKGGAVFVSTVAATAGQVYAASADAGAGPIALDSKSYFMGPPDANGITELAFNI